LPNAFVTAIFAGLMGFSYDAQRQEGRVGFHPGNSHHSLTVYVFQIDSGGSCSPIGDPIRTVRREITLQARPASTVPVKYYQFPGPFNRFDGDPYDFRWLPDLDGEDFYPESYAKHGHFTRFLRVKNATFYTRMRTNSTFNLVTQPDNVTPNRLIRHFGHVARYMAAAMPLPTGAQDVALQIDSQPAIPLPASSNVRYQILFENECDNCVNPSGDILIGTDETKRNDFHYARKALMMPGARLNIGLKLREEHAPDDPDFCMGAHRVTDPAPCMGAGYGGGNGP
jgi:hypothetical protein